jgi:hypothetical protein
MAISITAVAYGTVVAGALVLFAVGSSADRSAASAARLAGEGARAVPAYAAGLNQQLAAYAAAAGPHAPPATVEAAGIRLRSVGFDIPVEGRAFPAGPGADAMTANCTACHTSGMILTQPPLTRAEWTGEVNKMIHTYKAPVDAADVPAIVTYLAGMRPAP